MSLLEHGAYILARSFHHTDLAYLRRCGLPGSTRVGACCPASARHHSTSPCLIHTLCSASKSARAHQPVVGHTCCLVMIWNGSCLQPLTQRTLPAQQLVFERIWRSSFSLIPPPLPTIQPSAAFGIIANLFDQPGRQPPSQPLPLKQAPQSAS